MLNVTGADMTAWVAPYLKFRVVCSAEVSAAVVKSLKQSEASVALRIQLIDSTYTQTPFHQKLVLPDSMLRLNYARQNLLIAALLAASCCGAIQTSYNPKPNLSG